MEPSTSGSAYTALYSSLVRMRKPWRLMVTSLRQQMMQPHGYPP
jgi:hypothetical protein